MSKIKTKNKFVSPKKVTKKNIPTHKKVFKKLVEPVLKFKPKPIIQKVETEKTIEPEKIIEPTMEQEKQIEVINEPVVSIPEIQTQESTSMLDELMSETDKDNEPENETQSSEDLLNEFSNDELVEDKKPESETISTGEKITDKIHDTLTNDSEDWQNPSDFRKMCAVNAMMYVEGGAILLSFLGQMISGDWTPEGEKRYTPSEERRKLIRAPLAKKLELNKDQSKRTPTGALITAIIFTIIPIVIIAFKDRKARVKAEQQNLENIRLRNELATISQENEMLRSGANTNPVKHEKPLNGFIIKTRGRHKKDCQCDKCNLKRTKSKR